MRQVPKLSLAAWSSSLQCTGELVPSLLAHSCVCARDMFGDKHEYFTNLEEKVGALDKRLKRRLLLQGQTNSLD
eukprot:4474267-Amphidinium_carterae.1